MIASLSQIASRTLGTPTSPGQLLVGISLYPAEVEVTDGKHIIRPGAL